MDIINKVKAQYARVLRKEDWRHLQDVAEHYFLVAAILKKKDIHSQNNKLLLRNSQKRLFLGIGCELLLKSYYLKKGYCVNKVKKSINQHNIPVHKLSDIHDRDINEKDTYNFDLLINSLPKIKKFKEHEKIKMGFQIAMAFRNKEGHISFPTHEFDHNSYMSISLAVESFYCEAFGEEVVFNISMKPDKKGRFRKTYLELN